MIKNLELKLQGLEPINTNELFILVDSWGRHGTYMANGKTILECQQNQCYDLSKLDTSQITDLSYVFAKSLFNGDISNWDVSNVYKSQSTFWQSEFNGDLSKWNTSKFRDINNMFSNSKFNNDSLNTWDTSNIIEMYFVFAYSQFNGNISNWKLNNVESMNGMFYTSKFNNDSLKDWDVSHVEFMSSMFCYSIFNYDISNWNISNVKNISSMFNNANFNGDISKWKFNPNVDCSNIFYGNENFSKKYHYQYTLQNENKFLQWFEENRKLISNYNITKEEAMDIDDYLISFNNDSKLELKKD